MSKNGREAEEEASKRGKVIRTGKKREIESEETEGKSATVEERHQLRGKEIIRERGQGSGKAEMDVNQWERWWKVRCKRE